MDDGKRLQFEGKWDQMKGRVRESWGALTDDDLDRTQGKWDQVVGLIKEKTGENVEEIERRLHDMMDSLRKPARGAGLGDDSGLHGADELEIVRVRIGERRDPHL